MIRNNLDVAVVGGAIIFAILFSLFFAHGCATVIAYVPARSPIPASECVREVTKVRHPMGWTADSVFKVKYWKKCREAQGYR